MTRTYLVAALLLLPIIEGGAATKSYRLNSPDGSIAATVTSDAFTVTKNGTEVVSSEQFSLTLSDGRVLSTAGKPKKAVTRSVRSVIRPVVYKKAEIADNYNELTLKYKDYSVEFRAYDEGFAYRFVLSGKSPVSVKGEKAGFRFPEDGSAFVPYVRAKMPASYERQFFNSFENVYAEHALSKWEKGHLAFLPLVAESAGGYKVCINESGFLNYPGMYLSNEDGDSALEAVFPPIPTGVKQGGYHGIQAIESGYSDTIAELPGAEALPWRIMVVARKDSDLLDSDISYALAPETVAADWSWVKPGKVAWDWWNNWNITGVDFEAGINNDTYKYYIDFAASQGIEYVILDEGWSTIGAADLMSIVPEIDLDELVKYAGSKGVGLVLWAGYWAFQKDMETVCRHYSEMGFKGFKIDFMDYCDQSMVAFYEKAAATAAKYHMVVDFHGAFKPSGLQRKYPNVLNFEGVYGLEMLKFNPNGLVDMVRNDNLIPYLRMVAGPLDYTQGAMRNATKENYFPCNSEPMSQGTRCHQLALYPIFESPLMMLCDSPSAYLKEPECLKFISEIPTVWDETRAIDGKMGQYTVIARRKGNDWYIGAITNWDARDLEIDLSFLGKGSFNADIYSDGANAHRSASDYRLEHSSVTDPGKVKVHLAPGGGWAAKFSR